jgi:hypothetical protein
MVTVEPGTVYTVVAVVPRAVGPARRFAVSAKSIYSPLGYAQEWHRETRRTRRAVRMVATTVGCRAARGRTLAERRLTGHRAGWCTAAAGDGYVCRARARVVSDGDASSCEVEIRSHSHVGAIGSNLAVATAAGAGYGIRRPSGMHISVSWNVYAVPANRPCHQRTSRGQSAPIPIPLPAR